jgi:hypothetical protein
MLKAVALMATAIHVTFPAVAVKPKAVPARSKAAPVMLTATALRYCRISANINKIWYKNIVSI